jgi:hypothetical protein
VTASDGAVTVRETGCDVDGLKAAESAGVNTAVSWCAPTVGTNVVSDAVPLLTVAGLLRSAVPSLNCTVPAVAGLTVALRDTGVPVVTVEAEDVNTVRVAVGGGAVTTKGTVCDVDAAKTAGSVGVNIALNWWVPTGNCEMVPTAVPLMTSTGFSPRLAVPSLNCTVPTGVCGATPAAVCGTTFAVSATMVPLTTGEAGNVVRVVTVAVGARAPVTCRVPLGGAALATPPMSNNVPMIAAAIRKVSAAYLWKDLYRRMVWLHSRSSHHGHCRSSPIFHEL